MTYYTLSELLERRGTTIIRARWRKEDEGVERSQITYALEVDNTPLEPGETFDVGSTCEHGFRLLSVSTEGLSLQHRGRSTEAAITVSWGEIKEGLSREQIRLWVERVHEYEG